jgi:hypothetical protein
VLEHRRDGRRLIVMLLATVIAAGLALTIALISGRADKARNEAARQPPALSAGTAAAFRYLAAQRSNRCGLTPAELEHSSAAGRLQGSCCFPMDISTYEWQIKALRPSAAIRQIPTDPYDVPVALAQRLLRYDKSIGLSATQQATYDRAMSMSSEKGPCCCRCWRWSAFRGMSKYLITRANWKASRLALLIDDVEGCGGKGQPPTRARTAT